MKEEKTTIEGAIIAIEVGNAILKGLGELPKLKNNYKLVFDKYCKKIDQNIKEVKKNNLPDKEIEILENEKLYIECFCRFLQEESGFKLVGKANDKN